MRLAILLFFSVISIVVVVYGAIATTQHTSHQETVTVALPIAVPITKQHPAPPEVDVDQLHCLATNIYHEARGESYQGKVAVANVVMNRIHSARFPGTFCEVVHQAKYSSWWMEAKGKLVPIKYQCQFSWFCDGKSDALYLTDKKGRVIQANLDAWEESTYIASLALHGNLKDITHGATHYHANYVNPSWSRVYNRVAVIDKHYFYEVTTRF